MFGLNGELQIIPVLSLGGRDITDRLKESLMIEPSHPFEGGEFKRFHHFPRGPAMDQLGFVKAVDGFSQRIVVAVALAADRRLDPGFCQSVGVADGNVLRSAIRMMDLAGITLRPAGVERLLQSI